MRECETKIFFWSCGLNPSLYGMNGNFGREITIYTVIYGVYIIRVGQNHIYTVCIRYFWQGNHHIYAHLRCRYTVLANPIYKVLANPTFTTTHPCSVARGKLKSDRRRVCLEPPTKERCQLCKQT